MQFRCNQIKTSQTTKTFRINYQYDLFDYEYDYSH